MYHIVIDVLGGHKFLEGERNGDEDCDGDEEGENAGGGAEATNACFEGLEHSISKFSWAHIHIDGGRFACNV